MNEIFLKRMQKLLKDEYEDYEKSLDEKMFRGIRKNLLKDSGTLLEDTFKLQKSPFSEEGYYMEEEISGNHPFHLSGLFYMQEPSASGVVSVLNPQEKDWVLDLCAAPGGKSSQIASKLNNSGLLVSNEIMNNRANILLSNMERMGVSENIIVNSDPKTICKEMAGCFDKVVVDAPCSGEGMFKKHEKAWQDWSEEHVLACAQRQKMILEEAYKALKQEGVLVYSTCTYAMEENEEVIYDFLKEHEDMELVDCGVSFGRSGYPYKDLDVSKVRRIFPMDAGEGHFMAKLIKHGESKEAHLQEIPSMKIEKCVETFLKDQLTQIPAYFYVQNDKVYAKNAPFIKLKKSRMLRQGVLCGEIVKGRFEPHHHFYMCAAFDPYRKHVVELNEEEVKIYLSGNVLNHPCEKGYVSLTYKGYVLGFGKSDGSMIKNKYPKGLRVK